MVERAVMLTAESSKTDTLADILENLGNIPPNRIRFDPPPGTATERDVLVAKRSANPLICELVDGILVEKAMGTTEALLAGWILYRFWQYVETNDIGVAVGADGLVRLWRGLVRAPDAAFYLWKNIPGGDFPDDPIATLTPDLAVEVLSRGNTMEELQRKLREYFKAGTQLAWLVNHKKRIVEVYTSPNSKTVLRINQTLDGGAVLPGLKISLKQLFARRRRPNGRNQ